MSASLTGFTGITKRRHDVLPKETAVTASAYLAYISKSPDYTSFLTMLALWGEHLTDYNDPHKVAQSDISDTLCSMIYDLYVVCVDDPLWPDAKTFQTTVTPDQFFELVRRLTISNILYSASKATTDPQQLNLGADWGILDHTQEPVTETITGDYTSFKTFLQKNKTLSTPDNLILDGEDLTWKGTLIFPIFYMSYSLMSPLVLPDQPTGYQEMKTLLQRPGFLFAMVLDTDPTRTSESVVVTFKNATQILDIVSLSGKDKTVGIFLNGTQLGSAVVALQGAVTFIVDDLGNWVFQGWSHNVMTTISGTFDTSTDRVFTTAKLNWTVSAPDGRSDHIQSFQLASDIPQDMTRDLIPLTQ